MRGVESRTIHTANVRPTRTVKTNRNKKRRRVMGRLSHDRCVKSTAARAAATGLPSAEAAQQGLVPVARAAFLAYENAISEDPVGRREQERKKDPEQPFCSRLYAYRNRLGPVKWLRRSRQRHRIALARKREAPAEGDDMTEKEWSQCNDPVMILAFLHEKVSERRIRLYLCGGCRQIAHLFFRPSSLAAVEVAERFADGDATEKEVARAEWDAESPTFGYELDGEVLLHTSPYRMSVVPRLVEMGALPESALSGGNWQLEPAVKSRLLVAAELAYTCCIGMSQPDNLPSDASWFIRVDWPGRWLVNCVFGDPFHPATVRPAWRTSAVIALAKAIYDDRAFGYMPALARAFEEAGCDNRRILSHCKDPEPHVRGCWVVDQILRKQ